ncbi:hypothetical protein VXS05_17200 [Photobacterium toruni]|uniref:hypothetical protein n=1 Tax=Photobacterium TaxID=657 RepID=UPI001E3BE007|nr:MULTISPECIES: hypothetical protein [Photobacterium]MCD9504069.1 hypothetical protein [Photobacterium phosphoreum]MEC6816762.1 hypothetical protein [Photobacterium toruni]
MKKHMKWIVLGAVTIPTIGYLFYPMSSPSTPVPQTTHTEPYQVMPLPEPPKPQTPIVIQLDSNAKNIIKKSNELVQKQLDDALNKLNVVSPEPMSYQVPDMNKTYLTESDTDFDLPSISIIDQVQFRGLIENGQHMIAYLSIADNAPFKVHVGSTFQGLKVTRISLKGIEVRYGKQSRLLTGE